MATQKKVTAKVQNPKACAARACTKAPNSRRGYCRSCYRKVYLPSRGAK